MAGKAKLSARHAFNDNIADAETLVVIAKAMRNKRTRRMRRELRERLGSALGIPRKHWDHLDCIESEDIFAVFQPAASISRVDLDEPALRPLLRQALVAACGALETFVGDRVMERVGSVLRAPEKPARLLGLPMTVGDWLQIEDTYERRRWGLREIIEFEVRRLASPSPSQIGISFGVVGERELWKRVDKRRNVARGSSERALERIYDRRNRIAHQGDRAGRGRAAISVREVEQDIACIVAIVDGLDQETRG
jgi:RiboL-PSP-HEPN